ncbi:hypothetical protein OUZ56_022784 [Daphnia magna]|uniref:Uncharacterized protein n=1 Tax=Daphnia magna TaxID=35525 RepID=A0ABR0AXH8_9CRUS|nr:hypothetical protein OUZ56_022784 [Daphnia magna]
MSRLQGDLYVAHQPLPIVMISEPSCIDSYAEYTSGPIESVGYGGDTVRNEKAKMDSKWRIPEENEWMWNCMNRSSQFENVRKFNEAVEASARANLKSVPIQSAGESSFIFIYLRIFVSTRIRKPPLALPVVTSH